MIAWQAKTPRQQRIETALAQTTDRKLWRLLNRAWWREFFCTQDRASEVADNRTFGANEPYAVQGAVGASVAKLAPVPPPQNEEASHV